MKKLLPGVALGVVVAVLAPVIVWQLSSDDELRREGALAAGEPTFTSPNGEYSLVVGDLGVVMKGKYGSVTVNKEGALLASGSNVVKVTPTSVEGATGPPGPQGPPGPTNVVIRAIEATGPPGFVSGQQASCQSGEQVVGGGGRPTGTATSGMYMFRSWPLGTPGTAPYAWEVSWRNESAGERSYMVYVLCAAP